MAAGFGKNLIVEWMEQLFQSVSPSFPGSIHLALFTDESVPSGSTAGTEVSGGSYARVSLARDASDWDVDSIGLVSNVDAITWPTATADWGVIKYVGIYSLSSGGDYSGFAELDEPRLIKNGGTFSFAAGDLQFTIGDDDD